ncbi:hypothetical protein [Flavobacterium selenitireducens]|uniref:hypothetical protein n=1 Tax=Flavobacterium selenitireducens TaxID=2722704 RepID=UPI00168AB14E|nr:hypothetical protein [Flavobacterium selenitireducens]MBD3583036.1 hypothetical protein [Flavobacterium selenitireducens]
MDKIFDPVYRKEYMDGYVFGSNPFIEGDLSICGEAFSSGFYSGRFNYESKNGPVHNGIPRKIVTNEILEDFMLSGMLGMSIDLDGFNEFQIKVIGKWYMSGVEKYDPTEWVSLFAFMEGLSIGIEEKTDGYL